MGGITARNRIMKSCDFSTGPLPYPLHDLFAVILIFLVLMYENKKIIIGTGVKVSFTFAVCF